MDKKPRWVILTKQEFLEMVRVVDKEMKKRKRS
jgi:hypothetical protein